MNRTHGNSIEIAYNAFCKERFPLPSEKQVADLEERLGIPLPPDYRQFLLEFNGAFFTEPQITPPTKDCSADLLTVMGGINATHPSAELGAPGGYTPSWFDDNDPPQILPIGYTIMGNLIFLVTKPGADDCGAIGLKIASSMSAFSLGDGIAEFFSRLVEPMDFSN
jgi:hypothetical protein